MANPLHGTELALEPNERIRVTELENLERCECLVLAIVDLEHRCHRAAPQGTADLEPRRSGELAESVHWVAVPAPTWE